MKDLPQNLKSPSIVVLTGCYITKANLVCLVSPTKEWNAVPAPNPWQFLTPLLQHGRQS